MCPRRRRRERKAAATVEARAAMATSVTSFSKRPPLSLSEATRFFLQHLPSRYCGDDPCIVGNAELQRLHELRNSIHDAYLRALARLPFRAPDGGGPAMPSLLPALLAGGHCFRPFPDLASNVIVNTVWIHATSAPGRFAARADDVDVVDLDDIKGNSLRVLRRRLSPPCSPTDRDDDHDKAGESDYYYAAAVAAKHPNPEAFAQFAWSGVWPVVPASSSCSVGPPGSLPQTSIVSRPFLSRRQCPHLTLQERRNPSSRHLRRSIIGSIKQRPVNWLPWQCATGLIYSRGRS